MYLREERVYESNEHRRDLFILYFMFYVTCVYVRVFPSIPSEREASFSQARRATVYVRIFRVGETGQ